MNICPVNYQGRVIHVFSEQFAFQFRLTNDGTNNPILSGYVKMLQLSIDIYFL